MINLKQPFDYRTYTPTNPMGALATAQRTPYVSISSALPVSVLRNETGGAGTYTISASAAPGEHEIALGADGTASAYVQSRNAGSYTGGVSMLIGFGMRRPVAPVGSQVWRYGAFNGSDGFFVQEDAEGLAFVHRRLGVDYVTRRADWNIDRLDGRDASGHTGWSLDMSLGAVFEIEYTWFGYGAAQLFALFDSPVGQFRVLVHTMSIDGLTLRDPNTPVRFEASNGGTATAFKLYSGCRHISVDGTPSHEFRHTSCQRIGMTGIGLTPLPVLSVRPRASEPRVRVALDGIDAIADADMIVSLWLGGTLTGAAFGAITGIAVTDTMLELDTTASAFDSTGALLLWSGLVPGSSGSSRQLGSVGHADLGSAGVFTVTARRITGTNAGLSAVVRLQETW